MAANHCWSSDNSALGIETFTNILLKRNKIIESTAIILKKASTPRLQSCKIPIQLYFTFKNFPEFISKLTRTCRSLSTLLPLPCLSVAMVSILQKFTNARITIASFCHQSLSTQATATRNC